MGGPSSHLKQLKGLIRKAHQTLPLSHPKVRLAQIETTKAEIESALRAYDMEYIPPCDRKRCQNSKDGLWCSFPVAFPPRNWQTVFNARNKGMRELDHAQSIRRRVRKYVLPEDVMVYQPGSRKRTENGLSKFGMTLMDNIVSIDLQWNHPNSKVGILQVATSTFCLLIRGPKYWDRGLPEGLLQFFKEPDVMTLGFNFGEKDQKQLKESFGMAMEDFSNFVDVQALAGKCGYPKDASLHTLCRKVLGVQSHVKPELADVDWEAERLTATESFYAALSVFAIGQIYRQLRHWHALPKRCIKCRQELGVFYDAPMRCVKETCNETFLSEKAHRLHCFDLQHPYKSQLCSACYRILPLEAQTVMPDDACGNVKTEEIAEDDPIGRVFAQTTRHRRLMDLKERYREKLSSCDDRLIQFLYGDLNSPSYRF